jgi:hypothetical protein
MALAGSVRSALRTVALGNLRRFRCHGVAMEDVGKKRRFNKELSARRGSNDQRSAVEGLTFQPQSPGFDEIDSGDFFALSE